MKLTEWQRHLLVCLMEEAAEVQQAAAKMLRFEATGEGFDDDLMKELMDLTAIEYLIDAEEIMEPLFPPDENSQQVKLMEAKVAKVRKYYEEEQDAKQESKTTKTDG